MAVSSRKLFQAIRAVEETLPPNKQFLQDVMKAIEAKSIATGRRGSNWYKPSGLTCMRQMYFTRTIAEQDVRPPEYNAIGMADTGTRRHDAIQEVLLWMNENGYSWEYLDVAEYIAEKQKQGKCLNIEVLGKDGAETKLFDKTLMLSFRCDGVIRHRDTNKHYLFEFKNQISFKYNDKSAVDKEHHNQVIAYCTSLELEEAFVMYENRDVLYLEVPELFVVTPTMKNNLVNHIMECEGYVERLICPPKPTNVKCNFCNFKTVCRKAGN